MAIVTPKNVHAVESVSGLLEALDADNIRDEIAEKVDDMSMLTEPVIKEILKRQSGEYVWNYTHPEYNPVRVKVIELPVKTWSDLAGVSPDELPDICPACEGSHRFRVVQNSKDGFIYNAEEEDMLHEEVLEVGYSTVSCTECEALIVEDGEKQF